MTDLFQRVESQIQNRKLIKRGEKILVAVSGGIDSIILLHVLKEIFRRQNWKLIIAHFNHQLRGRASEADEKLVRKTAAAMRLPVVVESANVNVFARQSKLSIEMAARKLRHEFLARAAKKRRIRTVALAHHADDQVELFFLRLLRGAGGEGLAGMRWCSPSPADKIISIVRPLLDVTKSELQKFAHENKIRFREDASNFSNDFLRNRIRNELLPLLRKKYQPGLNQTVLRLMEITGAESGMIGELAEKWLKQRQPHFENLPVAVQRRALQPQLAALNMLADFELIESLRQSANCSVSVAPQISVSRDADGKIILRTEKISKFNKGERAVKLGKEGAAIFGGRRFNWKLTGYAVEERRGRRRMQKEFFDADKIGDEIILRHWRVGDRFKPIGLKSSVKLQDLFTNAKVPRERRQDLIVAEAVSGEIFWVEDLRISENFKITPKTRRRLIWHWKNQG